MFFEQALDHAPHRGTCGFLLLPVYRTVLVENGVTMSMHDDSLTSMRPRVGGSEIRL